MVLSPAELSLEQRIHGGYLHLAGADLSRRLQGPKPSLYDCLLASIYFRKSGDQHQALAALNLHADSNVFDTSYNRLQSLCHAFAFEQAANTADEALARWSTDWSEQQLGYVRDVSRVAAALSGSAPFPTDLRVSLLAGNGYRNLDSGEATSCTGVVDQNRRFAREVRAAFDPLSGCWIEQHSGCVIQELLQPNHDFRSFFGGATPWIVDGTIALSGDTALVNGIAVYVESNPHFGHFITQSASFANALCYAEHLTTSSQSEITVLSQQPITNWGQMLLQASCNQPLRFETMDRAQPLSVECLVVTPPTWIEWHYAHRDHARLFRKAARNWLEDRSTNQRKLYFSRSRLSECLRHSVNEEELEAELLARGFEVVHPQELPLPAIVQLVNEAELIVGAMGSAMHNVLFRLPDQPLITLNLAHHLPGINNSLVERCSGIEHNLYLRSCEEESAPGQASRLHFRLARCLAGVDQALDQLEQLS